MFDPQWEKVSDNMEKHRPMVTCGSSICVFGGYGILSSFTLWPHATRPDLMEDRVVFMVSEMSVHHGDHESAEDVMSWYPGNSVAKGRGPGQGPSPHDLLPTRACFS